MIAMPLTDREKNELRRMAANIEHFNTLLFDILIDATTKTELPCDEYDRLMGYYRAWLVFNELPAIRVGNRLADHITAYSRPKAAYFVTFANLTSEWIPESKITLA